METLLLAAQASVCSGPGPGCGRHGGTFAAPIGFLDRPMGGATGHCARSPAWRALRRPVSRETDDHVRRAGPSDKATLSRCASGVTCRGVFVCMFSLLAGPRKARVHWTGVKASFEVRAGLQAASARNPVSG